MTPAADVTPAPGVTERDSAEVLGLAHVASCSFLASRLAPSGQFWAALGGGIALARAASVHGLRAGYGASAAAIVQTVALIGPARVNGPLTQALNAPLVGWLHGRGARRAILLAACLAIRLLHYAALNVLFVVVVVGGLDEYVATYDKIAGWLGFLPEGQAAAVWLTIAGSVFYGLIFSTIQVLASERALRSWPPGADPPEPRAAVVPGRTRAVWTGPLLAAAAWVAMLAFLSWAVLAVVGAALAVAIVATRARRAGRNVWAVGVGLALVLAIGALMPAVIGAVEFDGAAQRAVRAALLVLTATWARAFTGSAGLREAARRALWRARAVPGAAEAARITEDLESDRRLLPAARNLVDRLTDVPFRPAPAADALTAWIAAEAGGYRPPR